MPNEDSNILTLKSKEFYLKYGIISRITLQLYLDLKIVKKWIRVDIMENSKLNLCFLKGKEGETVRICDLSHHYCSLTNKLYYRCISTHLSVLQGKFLLQFIHNKIRFKELFDEMYVML